VETRDAGSRVRLGSSVVRIKKSNLLRSPSEIEIEARGAETDSPPVDTQQRAGGGDPSIVEKHPSIFPCEDAIEAFGGGKTFKSPLSPGQAENFVSFSSNPAVEFLLRNTQSS
jgi:hypothetical protein